jgi:hypothetical protein
MSYNHLKTHQTVSAEAFSVCLQFHFTESAIYLCFKGLTTNYPRTSPSSTHVKASERKRAQMSAFMANFSRKEFARLHFSSLEKSFREILLDVREMKFRLLPYFSTPKSLFCRKVKA